MAYKSILIVQTVEQNPEALRSLLLQTGAMKAFAQILILIEIAPPPASSFGVVSQHYWDDYLKQIKTIGDAKKQACEEMAASIGVPVAVDVLALNRGELEKRLVAFGSCADIALYQNGAMFADALSERAFNDILFSTGLPILMLGAQKTAFPDIKRAMIAWDGGVEASKALRATMPMITKCEHVSITAVDPDTTRIGPAPASAVAEHLARHGVASKVDILQSIDRSVEESLLEHARTVGAEVIVMGGYAHSRIREWLIGGTTRSILKDCDLPVIMAH